MPDFAQTILQIINHILIEHPALAPHIESLASQAQGKVPAYQEWESRRFAAPSPHFIKQAVLLRHALTDPIWVETGTYRGETTQLLAGHAQRVYSIEPEMTLYAEAVKNFKHHANVELINGTSEDVFPLLLPKLSGNICFWLDGHYSGNETFKGPLDTPIVQELDFVAEHLPRWEKAVVLIDDIRLFTGGIHAYGAYPTLGYLADWASRNALDWQIEQDIFIAKKKDEHA